MNSEELKNQGNSYYSKGKYDFAITCYNKAIELNPNVAVYYTNRAKAQMKLKQYDQAMESCQYALDIQEQNIKAHYILGISLCEKGKKR